MSIEFTWDKAEFGELLDSCERDEARPLIEAAAEGAKSVLECGCGAGRWVRFLSDRGYAVTGLELSPGTLMAVSQLWPDLRVVCGDGAQAPFRSGSFDLIISLGVIEHWNEGPELPLREIFRLLKPGGTALITVPCLNGIRRLKRAIWWSEISGAARTVISGRLMRTGWESLKINRLDSRYRWPVVPPVGKFFEYHFSPTEFASAVACVGLEIRTHVPLCHIDGVFHEINPLHSMVTFEHWRFRPTRLAKLLNSILFRKPFLHSHMQAIVATRPT